jgi:thiosulfate reductase cytochrome b subunit
MQPVSIWRSFGTAAIAGRGFLQRSGSLTIVHAVLLCGLLVALPGVAHAAAVPATPASAHAAPGLDDASCLSCHDSAKQKLQTRGADGKPRALRAIDQSRYSESVHAKMTCVACHQDIVDTALPHKTGLAPKADCAQCHQALWDKAKQDGTTAAKPRLAVVAANLESYGKSYHAQPDKKDPTRAKAKCDNCHDTHYFNVPPAGTPERKGAWRLNTTSVCGETCHSDVLDDYKESVHGKAALEEKNLKSAVCIDCHTSHAITATGSEKFKTLITKECGTCHKENYGSYGDTYHGQVNRLGYGYTAKCHDCHGSHSILKVDDKESKVHPDNRLGTCRTCHSGKKGIKEATPGFLSFGPHANTHDFKRYPQVWLTARFMWALLAGVFAFFWLHSGLWYYREFKDRQERRARPHVKTEELPQNEGKQVRRFAPLWRVAHLCFALSVMLLVITGMTVFYSQSAWAPFVVKLFGGPDMTGLIHRVTAAVMLGIFFTHLIYVVIHLWNIRKTFRWFGPDSLVPSWQDLKDIIGMFEWFVGKGPKPLFDRWTYWERFDYWAVFWGMGIIGTSGMMLAFPTETASVLPGWVLNVATMVHGEEAFLAAVFLFTVHFFNNHFRPDKLPPPDVVMFTGSVPLEEFRREHPLQYRRLLESGELQNYMVDAPSKPMTLGSKVLGLVLIATGLTLLTLVAVGFFSS